MKYLLILWYIKLHFITSKCNSRDQKAFKTEKYSSKQQKLGVMCNSQNTQFIQSLDSFQLIIQHIHFSSYTV